MSGGQFLKRGTVRPPHITYTAKIKNAICYIPTSFLFHVGALSDERMGLQFCQRGRPTRKRKTLIVT
jgi:hypothetical protein